MVADMVADMVAWKVTEWKHCPKVSEHKSRTKQIPTVEDMSCESRSSRIGEQAYARR